MLCIFSSYFSYISYFCFFLKFSLDFYFIILFFLYSPSHAYFSFLLIILTSLSLLYFLFHFFLSIPHSHFFSHPLGGKEAEGDGFKDPSELCVAVNNRQKSRQAIRSALDKAVGWQQWMVDRCVCVRVCVVARVCLFVCLFTRCLPISLVLHLTSLLSLYCSLLSPFSLISSSPLLSFPVLQTDSWCMWVCGL